MHGLYRQLDKLLPFPQVKVTAADVSFTIIIICTAYSNMQGKLASNFENLNLGNLNAKLKDMRDKLRKDVDQDIQYMHFKMDMDEAAETSRKESHIYEEENRSSRNGQDAIEDFLNSSNSQQAQKEYNRELIQGSSSGYLNLELAEKPVDMQEIKRLAAKKISEAYWDEYIKCTLKQEVVERIKEIFDELQDVEARVQTKQLIYKINKLGIKYSEATAVEVPILKRKINLKKVLFELFFKSKIMPESITWKQFKECLQDYRFPSAPSIDEYIASETTTTSKHRNYFNISIELVKQLKNIYKKCAKEVFLSYCPLTSLLQKIQRSKTIEQNINAVVRPKSNYEVQVSLKDTIIYIKNYAPEFVDLDEFLLFFSVKGFTYYPIQQRFHATTEEINPIHKVKSDKYLPAKPKKKALFDQYELSKTKINSIRNHRLQEMLREQEMMEQSQLKKSFKARPMPKSISKEKYDEFMKGFNQRLEQGRKQINRLKSQSQQELLRLQQETKLFVLPKKKSPQHKSFQITARQLPETVKQPKLGAIQGEKISRRQKIFSQTCLKYQRSWQELPLVAKKNLSPKAKEQQAKQTYQFHVKEIPDYKAEQQRIQQQLRQKKQRFHPTEPEPFHFHTEARHPKRQHEEVNLPHSQYYEQYDYKDIIYSPEPQIYYTQKFADLVAVNKKKAEQKERMLRLKMQQDAERQRKHKNFSKFMKKNLSKLPNTAKICENDAKMKIERHKKYWRSLDKQYESDLNNIYAKILQRPFLYEMK